MLDKFHNWLIKLIIGKKMVIANAKFDDGIKLKPGQRGFINGCSMKWNGSFFEK